MVLNHNCFELYYMKTHFCLRKYILNTYNKKEYIFFIISVIFVALFSSCNQSIGSQKNHKKIKNTSILEIQFKNKHILQDTVVPTDTRFSIKNGIYFYNDSTFSGVLKTYYPRVEMTTYTSFYKGKRNGSYNSFYKNEQLYEVKQYQNNRINGKHLMYWKNGNLKVSYNYIDGKKEGTQKRWYDNGNQYAIFNYKNDKREGVQKAWRASGKLYINNEIKNGKTYGLNRASLCYKVKDEKPVILGYVKVPASDGD
jgi:antitoxin component YwqK of YwqJK toxin-antitoxin module